MKKIAVIVLSLCLMASCAHADINTDLFVHYNSWAETLKAPLLDKDSLNIVDNYYFLYSGDIRFVFEVSLTGAIRSGFIFTDDDSCAIDFLSSCIAMTAFFSDFSFDYYGKILHQFMDVHLGYSSTPHNIGTDAFQITTSDKGKYSFVYMNNDLKINE